MSSSHGRRATRVVGAAATVVVIGLVLLGVALHNSQRSARQSLLERFGGRAQVVSALTQAVLESAAGSSTSAREYGTSTVGGRLLDRAVAQGHLDYAVLLDRDGQLVAASKTLTAAERAEVLSSAELKPVLAGAPVSVSDVLPAGGSGAGAVDLSVSLNTEAGRRVLVSGIPGQVFGAFLGQYLARVPTPGGEALLLDSRGNVVAASNPRRAVGQAVAEAGLLQAASHRAVGPYGRDRYFTSVRVPSSTWRVVLTSSDAALFGSVTGARDWLPWVTFGALALVALGLLVALRRLLGIARALSLANTQLADTNARLESSNELLRNAAELSRSNAELEQFASIASHDLQEPLRKVQTFAGLLSSTERERLSEEGQDYLRRMSDAAGRMRTLIDDLLAFSRVSTQARPFVAVDLTEVVEQVLVDLEVSIHESDARVQVADLPTVPADPVQMRQLFQNLIGNALKFRRDGVTPHVRVGAVVDAHVAELTVADNGIGFDVQYATRIFRAFERLHGTRAYPGTGIGLALCRKIVERHNGTITAAGEVEAGATFTFRLPVEQPAEAPAPTSLFPERKDGEVSRVLV